VLLKTPVEKPEYTHVNAFETTPPPAHPSDKRHCVDENLEKIKMKKLEFHPSYPSAFSEIMKAEGYEG